MAPILELIKKNAVPVNVMRSAARGALPETVGEAGLLVDPDDSKEFATALSDVMVDAGLRAKLRDAGRRRAARFTWSATAELTDEAISATLDNALIAARTS